MGKGAHRWHGIRKGYPFDFNLLMFSLFLPLPLDGWRHFDYILFEHTLVLTSMLRLRLRFGRRCEMQWKRMWGERRRHLWRFSRGGRAFRDFGYDIGTLFSEGRIWSCATLLNGSAHASHNPPSDRNRLLLPSCNPECFVANILNIPTYLPIYLLTDLLHFQYVWYPVRSNLDLTLALNLSNQWPI